MPEPAFANPDQTEKQLAAYRGANRVLLVFAPSEHDGNYVMQERLWAGEKGGFAERDLVQIRVRNPRSEPAPLASRYGIKGGQFGVVLIGKDGHNAYQVEHPVSANDIFERIDAMPMRRQEIGNQRNRNGSTMR